MTDTHRGGFTTADAGEAAETLSRLIGRAQVQAPANDSFELALSWAVAGPVMCRRAQVGRGSTVRMGVESPQTINIAQVSDGAMTVRAGGDHHRLGPGPYRMPQDRFTSTMEATDLSIVAVDHAWVQDYAGELLQLEDFRLRLTGTSPHHQAAAAYWADAVGYLREVLNDAEAVKVPLIVAEAQRRVATALLCCFPSTFTDHALPNETSTRLPGPVRRAVTYIDEHLGEPIELAHLAAAARIPTHQLVIAFRQHLGTTPGGYLRTARLDAAHHDLLEADLTRGDTVGAIAYRCGFTNLARFATDYRTQYGRTPTETLHS
ncbi:helix-turn-helix domain-containing protein [Kocuria sp. M4R2S49]|uniref:AraC family transcriptional regulator n=1 Tax=Kocuria rhizosphaericola TaxID=3376284 RepID=UPI0037A14241